MGFFDGIFEEFDRFFDRRLGIDDPNIRTAATALATGGASLLGGGGARGGAEKSTDPKIDPMYDFDPFAVDNSMVIGAQDALRKRLANRRGLSSTNVSGGRIKSTATGVKPTLFTFS